MLKMLQKPVRPWPDWPDRMLRPCVGWNKISADYYELEYDRQNRKCLKVKSTECKLDSTQVCFPNNISYKIRVRGVNGRGPGEWSETTVGTFTVLPKQPQKPIAVYVNSSISITLVVKKPEGREGAKPVTAFVVEYHTENNREMTRRIFPVDNLEMVPLNGMDTFKIDLNCDAASIYLSRSVTETKMVTVSRVKTP